MLAAVDNTGTEINRINEIKHFVRMYILFFLVGREQYPIALDTL